MRWPDWLSIESWFFTTAAAQGLRDARHDYPREDTCMLILMTGAFASFYTHDGDRDLERVVHQKARLQRELSRWWRRWSHAAARYDRIVKTARERINRIMHEFEAMVGEYRFYNTRKRDKYSLNGDSQVLMRDPRKEKHAKTYGRVAVSFE